MNELPFEEPEFSLTKEEKENLKRTKIDRIARRLNISSSLEFLSNTKIQRNDILYSLYLCEILLTLESEYNICPTVSIYENEYNTKVYYWHIVSKYNNECESSESSIEYKNYLDKFEDCIYRSLKFLIRKLTA